ncbi:SPFH domain-containing protein [Labilibacter marinus]|uniref:SPFH domain-containing protein n=1 Tax=Labilibacter marinus TaxID=1477105 RepID=UPI000835219E|nr:SPFH domain-containing protein [Labilibacter marinus]
MKADRERVALNGYVMILVLVILMGLVSYSLGQEWILLGIVGIGAMIFVLRGLFVINPNSSRVLLLFGAYSGTIKKNGFGWVLPFYTRKSVSLRARNFESERLKVNDKLGNPIMISAILVWKVSDTFKALFDVDNYEDFVKIQTDAAVRKLAGSFPYDQFEDDQSSTTLSSNFEEVNKCLEKEITDRLSIAGLTVIEARLGYLAYAPEIAQAMLKRQQATAIIAARTKIVEGAVGMVESALHLLSEKQIINLDEEKKAAMVSNLLTVLCSDSDVEPIINTGTLNH